MAKFLLGLGSNLGNRMHNLNLAIGHLSEFFRIEMISSIYRSNALSLDNHPPEWKLEYLNLCLIGATDISPQQILKYIKRIEGMLGRDLGAPIWSPRTIDIDILMVDDIVLDTEDLTLPHPGFLIRDFALIPSKEIASDMMHPIALKQLKYCAHLIQTGCKKI